MTDNDSGPVASDLNRRDFIRGASFASLMVAMGGIPLHAETTNTAPADAGFDAKKVAPVSFAVIGCGAWGREILQTLAILPYAPVVAICDSYPSSLRRAKELAPSAATYEDYHKLLDQKDVEAVIIATPTHQHKEIVLAALQAGKHVYCEAPLANTIEDARAIAKAAKDTARVYFQSGLQMRSDPEKIYILDKFIHVGSVGTPIFARAQSHANQSWRRSAGNPEREKELNWRLNSAISTGLVGELGIHQLDLISWFVNDLPSAVTGFGANLIWKDGRDVNDTVQAVVQYAGKKTGTPMNFTYDSTLGSTFESDYSVLYGVNATVLMRDRQGWLFQETNSPLQGWEVFAAKVKFGNDLAISLAADATHSVKKANDVPESPFETTALHQALIAFHKNVGIVRDQVQNYIKTYGDDLSDLPATLATYKPTFAAAADHQAGFEATVTAIKANEATVKGDKVTLSKEMFEI
jgi:predicted dehydrogenase